MAAAVHGERLQAAIRNAAGQFAAADDAAQELGGLLQFARQQVPSLRARVRHARGVNQDRSAPGGRPAAYLNRFASMNQQRRPGLFQR